MTNSDIRQTAKDRGIKLWQIADALNIADSGFSKKLRKELPAEEKAKIRGIIEKLAREVD